jgi:hypothetical protein
VVAAGRVFAVEGGLEHFVRIPWTRSAEELETAVERLAETWAAVREDPDGRHPGGEQRLTVA